jgi:hypothetical protein
LTPFPIGAPIILTQDFMTAQTQTPSILTAIPQNSVLPNGQSNFLQIFTPFPTIEQMGGLLTNETQLFEYSNSAGR